MTARPLVAVVAAVTVTVGIAAWRVLPASSGSDRFTARDVAGVVALLHHDQQGIVLAHQAEAQSPLASTRDRAASLAGDFQWQARALTGVLNAHRVPTDQRLVDTTRLDIVDAGAVGCDLMPKDAVSNLAATAPIDFDATFTTLMGRHLVGGLHMAATVLDGPRLDASQRAAVRASQRALA